MLYHTEHGISILQRTMQGAASWPKHFGGRFLTRRRDQCTHGPRSNSMENTLPCFQPRHRAVDGLDSIYLFPHSPRATEGGILGYCTFWEKKMAAPPSLPLSTKSRDTKETCPKVHHHNLCLLGSPQEEYQKQSRTSKGFPKWAEQKWAERLLVVQTFDIDIITSRILLKYRNFDRLQRF
jgi:hypothetical protein